MPSTSITDYQVLQDGNVTLSEPVKEPGHVRHVTWTWQRPDDLHFTSSIVRSPVLSFKVRVFENTPFFIKMNGQVIVSTSLDPDNVKVWWEVIRLSDAFPNGRTNDFENIVLEIDGGHMRLSDVILWYQINR